MDLLVAGGSGFIGQYLCQELLERDHTVTVLSRSPEADEVPAGVDTVAGDITSYDELPSIVDGHDAVIHLVSLSPVFRPRGGSRAHEQVTVDGTRNLVRAMEETGVSRILYLSGLGADTDAPTAFLRTKGRAEGIIRSSNLEWTIVRPSVVFGNGDEFMGFVRLLTTPYLTALPSGGSTRFQPICVGDLVEMLADCLDRSETFRNTAVNLGGPESLTLADITRLTYGADGRSVRIIPIPMPLTRLGLTLAGPIPFIPFGVDQYRSLKLNNVPEDNEVDLFDKNLEDLKSLRDYLNEQKAS